MASSGKLTVVHRCSIAPPPRSVPPTLLPLTFFDVPWLLFSPAQPLFFYDYPTTTGNFTQTILPNLKRTLSLTLQQFFPLAGKIHTPPPPAEPSLEYSEDDSVLLTIAEAAAFWAGGFQHLSGNHLKIARDFHCLVPVLRSTVGLKQPLLAIQITVFPGAGICLGFTFRHVTADLRTFNNFLKTWASLSKKNSKDLLELNSFVAFHDRSVIRDPSGLKQAFLKEWRSVVKTGKKVDGNDANWLTRATFVMGPKEMERIKKWILDRSETLFGSTRMFLSPYVLTCAFVWACWMKTHGWSADGNFQGLHHLGFIAGGVTRVGYTVPTTYVGNCVGFGRASVGRSELIGENGVAYAAKALGDTIEKLNSDLFGGAKNWISEWKAIHESELHLMVTGSPKVEIYGLDFGWGRPGKIEEVSIDTTGAISLYEGREVVGSIEIGLALPKSKMDSFSILFRKGLY